MKRIVNAEHGTTALFTAAIILPLMFFLFSLSIDVSSYFREMQRIQKGLDDAALYGFRFLPYQKQARQALSLALSQSGIDPQSVEVTISSRFGEVKDSIDYIKLSYTGSHQLTFARFFGFDAGVPMALVSRARANPFDVMVALDLSAYLAPDLAKGAPWGTNSEWPSASFFQNEAMLKDGNGNSLDARLLTEQCFNEAISFLKLGAISAYDYFSAFSSNAVGLVFYPGLSGGVELSRDVVPSGRDSPPFGASGESQFGNYAGDVLGDVLCAAAAERETSSFQYRFPGANTQIEGAAKPSPLKPLNLVVPPQWDLNADALPFLRAREVIWSKAVHAHEYGSTDILFDELRSRLLGSAVQASRRGLSDKAAKVAFIFAGDVPHVGGARFPDAAVQTSLLSKLGKMKTDVDAYALRASVYYVLSAHEGNRSADFEARLRQLQEFFETANAEQPEHGHFIVKLAYGENPQNVLQSMTGSLLLERKTVVVSE